VAEAFPRESRAFNTQTPEALSAVSSVRGRHSNQADALAFMRMKIISAAARELVQPPMSLVLRRAGSKPLAERRLP
jgi:hypothetical protein